MIPSPYVIIQDPFLRRAGKDTSGLCYHGFAGSGAAAGSGGGPTSILGIASLAHNVGSTPLSGMSQQYHVGAGGNGLQLGAELGRGGYSAGAGLQVGALGKYCRG